VLALWCFDRRGSVLVLAAAFLAASLWLAGRARIDNSFENFFDTSDPAYGAYLQYRRDFGSDEVAYLLYEVPDRPHGVFDLEVMRAIASLTRALEEEVPFVYEVTSLVNAEIVRGVAGGIEIHDLLEEFPETQEQLLAARELVLSKPMYVGGIVSADARYGAVVVEMDRSSTDPLDEIRLDPEAGDVLDNLYPQVSQAKIEETLARAGCQGLRFHVSGDAPLNAVYNWIIDDESQLLDLATTLVVALLLLLFFRSWVGVIGPVVVVQLSLFACVAFVALVGWNVDMMFGALPTLLVAVGVAHSVHILSEFQSLRAQLGDPRAAARRSLELVGAPCLITSLTTAAGFLAMGVAPIATIWHMAVYSAVGVMTAFALSVTLLVALLSFDRRSSVAPAPEPELERAKGGRRFQAGLAAVARANLRHRRELLFAFGAVFVLSLVGIARLRVDSNWLDDLTDRVPIKGDTVRIDSVMGGLNSLVYLFDSGRPEGVKDPAVLRDIRRVQREAERHDLVQKTYSVVDILEDLNQAFHEGDPAQRRLPDTRQLVAQYLLLYESSGGEEVEEYLSGDFARASLEVRTRIAETSALAGLADEIEASLESRPLAASTMERTGIGELWLQLLEYIVSSQVRGVLLAFASIATLLCLIFRSLRTGLVAMIPNVAPVVLTLGFMGWWGIPLDYNKLMIATVAIGIAVDDTIHMMMRCHHEFRRCGRYDEAIEAAFADVGRALVITSVALVLGFLVLVLSVMASRVVFGVLLASTIATALVADFLLLPSLLLRFQPFGPEGGRTGDPRDRARPKAA
jgi:predicted RND superfamily exporter protein